MESFRNFVRGWFGRMFLTGVLVVFVVAMFWKATPAGSQGELVKVNGQAIFKPELDQAVESVMARYGGQIDRKTLEKLVSRDAVLENLVRQHAMIDAARDMGVVVEPKSVQDTIKSIPAFRDEAGNFSQDRFQQAILRNGFANAAVFRTRVEEELISEQVQGALNDSAFATKQDLELLTRVGEQKRDLAWVVLAPAAFERGVVLTDAEVQARYDANPAGYMTEETFAVDYVEVKLDDYAASQQVTDEAARGKYDDMVKKAGENAERRIAHILVAVNKERSPADARARADEILARLAKGESFAALAAQYSDDKGSSASGGDLGYLGHGVLGDAMDAAVAGLKVNDVSAPVQAEDGLHLLKVLDVRQVQMPSFESSKAGIVAALKREQAKAKFDEVVGELGTQAYESDNLRDPAAKLGLQVRSIGPFGRSGGQGIVANPKVMDEVLSPEVLEEGRNSGVIETGEGQVVVLHLKEHHPAERRPFAEVAPAVRNDLLKEKAAAVAKEKAAALQVELAAGKPIDEVAKSAGLAVVRVAGAQRASHDVPHEVLQAGFQARAPAAGAVSAQTTTLADGSQAVVAVSNVVDGTLLGVSSDEQLKRRAQLAGELGRYDFARFIDSATAAAKVVRVAVADKAAGEGEAMPADKKGGTPSPAPKAP